MLINDLNYNSEYLDFKATCIYVSQTKKKLKSVDAGQLIIRCLRRMVAVVVTATRMFGIVDAIHRGVRLY